MQQQWQILAVIARAREILDLDGLLELPSDDVVYESQDATNALTGIAEVSSYLRARFEFFRESNGGAPRVRLLLATVDLPEGRGHPCLIFTANGFRAALWVACLTKNMDHVRRLDILTVLPHPNEAAPLKLDS